jgi:gamma-glutamyltranspeptidase/glutathione hydrolase
MSFVNPAPFTTRPEIVGTFGVAATTHWIATAVAMGILERGGNAFDAGVAAALTLQVVEPHLCGPLGDVPVMISKPGWDAPQVVCGQGPAPAGATLAHYRDHLGLDLVPGTGLLAACIPGTFPTYMKVLAEHGTLRLRDVLDAAIGYATHGHPLVERAVATIETVRGLFTDHWPTSAAVYLPHGRLPEVGALFANAAHAATYTRLLREAESGGGTREQEIMRAERAWSAGFVAEAVEQFCRSQEVMDTSGRRHRGVLTGQDMATWRPTVEAPVHVDYAGRRVFKPGPWTQGPVLLQMLRLMEGTGIDRLSPTSPEFLHIWIEAAKLAYADREVFYGDPARVEVPIETLLSKAYADTRRKLIGDTADLTQRPGRIEGYGGRMIIGHAAHASGSAGAGEPTVGKLGQVKGDTVHIDIIDRAGNVFTATPSGGWLQSSPVIPALGFPLGTRGQMFWLEDGLPGTLAPGKRPRSTLSVGMAFRDGRHELTWGTPGGDQQDQWACQMFQRYVHARQNLQEAIDAPSWHIEHFPASFWPRAARPGVVVVEGRMPTATIDGLRRRGHLVEVGADWSEGRLTAAAQNGPYRRAAANARGMQGYAAGR